MWAMADPSRRRVLTTACKALPLALLAGTPAAAEAAAWEALRGGAIALFRHAAVLGAGPGEPAAWRSGYRTKRSPHRPTMGRLRQAPARQPARPAKRSTPLCRSIRRAASSDVLA